MLFKVNIGAKTATEVAHVTLSDLQLKERYDLQEWILQTPKILGEDLLVITSEFSGFDKTSERLDVLAIDKRGIITVVELKRSAVGTAAELQALRYAAYCSTMTFNDITELMAAHESRRTKAQLSPADAERMIKMFVDVPDFGELADKPRIILGAEEFSPEITSTALWLRSFGVDISCVRLRPYSFADQILLDSAVLIPLPEAREYQIRRDNKDADRSQSRPREAISPTEFLMSVSQEARPALEHIRAWLLSKQDIEEEAFKTLLSYRRRSNRDWVTWLQHTRYEARVALPPETDVDPTLFVRKSSSGWPIVKARSIEEATQVETLLQSSLARDHDFTES